MELIEALYDPLDVLNRFGNWGFMLATDMF